MKYRSPPRPDPPAPGAPGASAAAAPPLSVAPTPPAPPLWCAALAWPLWATALAAAAGLAAWAGERALPLFSGDLVLLVLPVLLIPGLIAQRARLPAVTAWWCAAAFAFLAVQAAISCAHPPLPPVAWRHFAVRALVPVMALAVAAAPLTVEAALAALAWSGGLACAAYLGLEAPTLLTHGWLTNDELRTGNVVFGNVSWVVNALAPGVVLGLYLALGAADAPAPARRWRWVLIAGLVAVLAFGIIGGRQGAAAMPAPWWLAGALAAGCAALGWLARRARDAPAEGWRAAALIAGFWLLALIALCSGRRGFLAVLIAVTLWFAYDALSLRFPRLARAGALALLALVTAALAAFLLQPELELGRHNDRVIMARAALEAVGDHPWFGQGDAGTLRVTLAPGRFAGYTQWFGINLGHSHDEALELLVSAGVVGLAWAGAAFAWLGWRALTLAHAARRRALAIVLIAMAVPALSDPTWSRPLAACAFGAALGIALKAIAEERGAVPARGAGAGAAWVATVGASACATVAAALALFMAPAALLADGPFSTADLRLLCARSGDAGTIMRCGNSLLRSARTEHDLALARSTISTVDAALGPASWGPERFATLVVLSDQPAERAAACCAGLAIYPFEAGLYEALERDRRSHPELSARIPPRIAARLQAYFSLLPAEPELMAGSPLTFDDAADQYAVLSGRTLTTSCTPTYVDQVERLVLRYRRLPCMSALVFRSAVLCPEALAQDLLARMPGWRLTAIDPTALAGVLSSPFTPPQAARVVRFLAIMFPAESAQAQALLARGAPAPMARATITASVWDFLAHHPPAPGAPLDNAPPPPTTKPAPPRGTP